jgi:PAS domain S-box-containing protein
MKSFHFIPHILVLAVTLFICVPAQLHSQLPEEDEVVYYGNNRYPPYEYMKGNQPEGFTIDILREIEQRSGIPIRIHLVSWGKIIDLLEKNPESFSALHDHPRPGDNYLSSHTLSWTRPTLYINNFGPVQDEKDLRGRVVFVISELQLRGKDLSGYSLSRMQETGCLYTSVQSLAEGQINALVAGEKEGRYIQRYWKLRNISPVALDLPSRAYRFVAHSTNPELVETLNRELISLRSEKKYHEIYTKWFEDGDSDRESIHSMEISTFLLIIIPVIVLITGFWVWTLQRMIRVRTRSLHFELTERKKTERELKKERDFTAAIISASPTFIVVLDSHLKIIMINEFMLRALDYSREEVKGKDFIPLFVDTNQREDARRKLFNMNMESDRTIRQESIILDKSGERHLTLWHYRPIFENNKYSYLIGVGMDITERRRMEEELLKNSKIESISVLAGGIAHDFNNLLTAILGNLSLARRRLDSDDITGILEDAEKVALRAMGLTGQLLTFSKGGVPIKSIINARELLRDSISFILSGSKIRYELSAPDDLWNMEVDESQISQVFYNLTINALQAMPEGGTISVHAENVTIGHEDALPLETGPYLRITMEDEGSGIAEEIQDKIFDPYFTTKEEGTGLGLSTSFSILKKHGGHITYRNREDGGSRFILYIPATNRPVSREASKQKEVSLRESRVLVMDDEEMVLRVISRMLEQLGMDVVTCKNGSEAIDLYRQEQESGNPFDTVIMDLTVPGEMGGQEAVTHIRSLDEGARVIVSSGYTNDHVLANYREYGFDDVLIKPYRMDNLEEVLTRVLANNRP